MIGSILLFLIVLSVLVLVHEFGHYIVAKWIGVWVEEFGWGFPPRMVGKKLGETLYSINWLPLGGFVRLHGEQGQEGVTKPERAFVNKSKLQRSAVIVAGIIMNLLLAVFLFYIYLSAIGFDTTVPKIVEHNFVGANQSLEEEVIITAVSEGSPAEASGVLTNSTVVSVGGEIVGSADGFVDLIDQNKGSEVSITLENIETGETYDVQVTPREDPPENEGALGVGFFPFETYVLTWDSTGQKSLSGITHGYNMFAYNAKGLLFTISRSVEEKSVEPVSGAVAGPLGLFFITEQVAKAGVLELISFMALVSLSLALLNILPIPPLDGGRLLFIGIEAVLGKKLTPKIEGYAQMAGLLFFLLLFVAISISDVRNFIGFNRLADLFN